MIDVIQTYKHCYNNFNDTYFNYYCFVDNDLLNHIIEFDNSEVYLTYLNLPSKIHQIDLWRYVYIYIHGGLYMDIDIFLKNDIINHISIFENNNLVIFKESPNINDGIIMYLFYCFKYFFRIIDHPRFFQYRQSIFFAKPNNSHLKELIEQISFNFQHNYHYKFIEPDLTFELTGPGIFTDVIKYGHPYEIEYSFSKQIIDYHSSGSWRTQFNPYLKIITFLDILLIICGIIIFFLLRKKKYLINTRLASSNIVTNHNKNHLRNVII